MDTILFLFQLNSETKITWSIISVLYLVKVFRDEYKV